MDHEFRSPPSNINPKVKELCNVHERDMQYKVGGGQRPNVLERVPVPNVQEAVWAPESFWSGVEKPKSLAHTEVQTPNPPTCGKSLYLLCYSAVLRY